MHYYYCCWGSTRTAHDRVAICGVVVWGSFTATAAAILNRNRVLLFYCLEWMAMVVVGGWLEILETERNAL